MTGFPQRTRNWSHPGVQGSGIGFSHSSPEGFKGLGWRHSILKQWFWAPTLTELPGGPSPREALGICSSADGVRVEEHLQPISLEDADVDWCNPLHPVLWDQSHAVLWGSPKTLDLLVLQVNLQTLQSCSLSIGQVFAAKCFIMCILTEIHTWPRGSLRNSYYCFIVETWKAKMEPEVWLLFSRSMRSLPLGEDEDPGIDMAVVPMGPNSDLGTQCLSLFQEPCPAIGRDLRHTLDAERENLTWTQPGWGQIGLESRQLFTH